MHRNESYFERWRLSWPANGPRLLALNSKLYMFRQACQLHLNNRSTFGHFLNWKLHTGGGKHNSTTNCAVAVKNVQYNIHMMIWLPRRPISWGFAWTPFRSAGKSNRFWIDHRPPVQSELTGRPYSRNSQARRLPVDCLIPPRLHSLPKIHETRFP